MAFSPEVPKRLDSWKAIADYLQRDVATVRRWEKNLALPIHRVGGIGRSVFADPAEIDVWLKRAKPSLTAGAVSAPVIAAATPLRRQWSQWILLLIVAAAAVVGLFTRPAVAVGELNVEATAGGVIARDAAGVEQWRHEFAAGYMTVLPPGAPVQVVTGKNPGVYVATSYRARQLEDQVEGGELSLFDMTGRQQRSFSFSDRVSFHGQPYGAPWVVSGFAVNPAGGEYAVAVTGHHYAWDPGLLTVLDTEWRPRGTFVHAGWIEQVRWLDRTRLVIGGFSNAHDGGMVSLLDATAIDGQGPEPSGSRHFCETCGPNAPLRMVIFPRTELNRRSGSPFNRVLLNTSGDRLSARTVEMPAERGDADAVYEFTKSLELVSAQFSERYWEMHRRLEDDGRITHRRDACPDRDGPREIQMWEPASGWRTVRIR